ncbi:hypothetical protein CDD83_1420 [Cordyceps sp. RAO-2017]|nr:hypothetical protein CDD83_1420 [Cordyceps sp. RAO-2017]
MQAAGPRRPVGRCHAARLPGHGQPTDSLPSLHALRRGSSHRILRPRRAGQSPTTMLDAANGRCLTAAGLRQKPLAATPPGPNNAAGRVAGTWPGQAPSAWLGGDLVAARVARTSSARRLFSLPCQSGEPTEASTRAAKVIGLHHHDCHHGTTTTAPPQSTAAAVTTRR